MAVSLELTDTPCVVLAVQSESQLKKKFVVIIWKISAQV